MPVCSVFTFVAFAELVLGLVDRMGALRQMNPKTGTENSVYVEFADELDKVLTRA